MAANSIVTNGIWQKFKLIQAFMHVAVLQVTLTICIVRRSYQNSEYDQKIPQSQSADKPMAPHGRATRQSQDTRKTNQAKQPAPSSQSR